MNKVLCLCLVASATLPAQQNQFTQRLIENRHSMQVSDGKLTGAGAQVLRDAVVAAQFVIIGENHGIAEIPGFVSGLCEITGPNGFHTMAVETGQLPAAELAQWIRIADGRARLVEFEKQHPDSLAFYNMQQEYDALFQCAHSALGGKLRLWGLDQEFLGSAGLILTRILTTRPGKQAAVAVQHLLEKEREAKAKAMKTGNPYGLFLFTASDAELTGLKGLLSKEGNEASRTLMDSLLKTRDIYAKNRSGSGYASNRERAMLLKTNFMSFYEDAVKADGRAPKVLFKFGANHSYKGFNWLLSNDLGNFVAELAEGQGMQSVHILVAGVKGSQLAYSGVGKPYQPAAFELSKTPFQFLEPLYKNLVSDGWTLFDLRSLRPHLGGLPPVSKELERVITGYDLVVLIPEVTASKQIR